MIYNCYVSFMHSFPTKHHHDTVVISLLSSLYQRFLKFVSWLPIFSKAFFIPKNGLHIISWFTFPHADNFIISISMDWKCDTLNLALRHIKRFGRENCCSVQEFIFSPLVAHNKHSGQLVWDSKSVLLSLLFMSLPTWTDGNTLQLKIPKCWFWETSTFRPKLAWLK